MSDQEFVDGYLDGCDPESPEPSANRSARYRHSWHVGRAEIENRPIPAALSRIRAEEALREDEAR